jgi:hypothetical protein
MGVVIWSLGLQIVTRSPGRLPASTTHNRTAHPHPTSRSLEGIILGICFYDSYGCDARFERKILMFERRIVPHVA